MFENEKWYDLRGHRGIVISNYTISNYGRVKYKGDIIKWPKRLAYKIKVSDRYSVRMTLKVLLVTSIIKPGLKFQFRNKDLIKYKKMPIYGMDMVANIDTMHYEQEMFNINDWLLGKVELA